MSFFFRVGPPGGRARAGKKKTSTGAWHGRKRASSPTRPAARQRPSGPPPLATTGQPGPWPGHPRAGPGFAGRVWGGRGGGVRGARGSGGGSGKRKEGGMPLPGGRTHTAPGTHIPLAAPRNRLNPMPPASLSHSPGVKQGGIPGRGRRRKDGAGFHDRPLIGGAALLAGRPGDGTAPGPRGGRCAQGAAAGGGGGGEAEHCVGWVGGRGGGLTCVSGTFFFLEECPAGSSFFGVDAHTLVLPLQ